MGIVMGTHQRHPMPCGLVGGFFEGMVAHGNHNYSNYLVSCVAIQNLLSLTINPINTPFILGISLVYHPLFKGLPKDPGLNSGPGLSMDPFLTVCQLPNKFSGRLIGMKGAVLRQADVADFGGYLLVAKMVVIKAL